MKKKLLCLLLAVVMLLSIAACGSGDDTTTDDSSSSTGDTSTGDTSTDTSDTSTDTGDTSTDTGDTSTDEATGDEGGVTLADISGMDYTTASETIYEEQLGEFYSYYVDAKSEVDDLGLRYALMAVAEAKMLEASGMKITYTSGGNYAISRAATRTTSTVSYGTDSDRQHSNVVIDDDSFITAEDMNTLREMWIEEKEKGTTGAEWIDIVKEYLTGKGYALSDSYSYVYSSDPDTFDLLSSSRSVVNEPLCQTIDGLMEYDSMNILQPALAESYEISDDGLTYTFHIRQGVEWVDSQGRKVADVKADDWVAGLQHVMDTQGGLGDLVSGVIVGVTEYLNGETTDMSTVGVEATDDYTLVYHLVDKCPYFLTMLGYSTFAPMSRDYYVSQGGTFGLEYDPTASTYNYGKDPGSIAYCGPYRITNYTARTTVVYTYNDSYWNPDAVNVHSINWVFNDGSDALFSYNNAKSGTLTGAGLNTNAVEQAKTDGVFDEYAYTSLTVATSYTMWFNLNRNAYANFNDSTVAVSQKTDAENELSKAAMRLQDFRLAVNMSLDMAGYNGLSVGENLKYVRLRNTYTPGDFVQLPNEATVDINGTPTTFAEGTYYGEIIQAVFDADGLPVTVWSDETLSSDGFDGWYNPDAAVEYMAKAVTELQELGYEVTTDNPVVLDYPYYTSSEVVVNQSNFLKKSIEDTLGGLVQINLVATTDGSSEWNYCGYMAETGEDANYELYTNGGWGPDYGDPQTYLDTLLPNYEGYMTKSMGIF